MQLGAIVGGAAANGEKVAKQLKKYASLSADAFAREGGRDPMNGRCWTWQQLYERSYVKCYTHDHTLLSEDAGYAVNVELTSLPVMDQLAVNWLSSCGCITPSVWKLQQYVMFRRSILTGTK
jgi:hypothetical protein